MKVRRLGLFPGIVASVLITAAPAFAQAATHPQRHSTKDRTAALHRRLTSSRNNHSASGHASQVVVSEADILNAQQLQTLDGSNSQTADISVPLPKSAGRSAPRRSDLGTKLKDVQTAVSGGATVETGIASYYGTRWRGRMMSSGHRFNPMAMTAAHRYLPFGTRVVVTDVSTRRSVVVTITDRPGSRTRIIDLSEGAAQALGIVHRGVAEVTLSRL
jgi:rare lipoprotein A